MGKNNIVGRQDRKKKRLTIGLDLGDRSSRYCVLDEQGEVVSESGVPTTRKGFAQAFGSKPRSRIALEVGTHSPWVSRCLKDLGHEVIVANARRVRLIAESSRKNDRLDAKTLARLARIDPELLSPIQHRGEQAQTDLMLIRARAALVEVRTRLVNCARGMAKSYGERLRSCGTPVVREELAEALSEPLREALKPLLAEVESVSGRIREYDKRIENIAQSRYPETALLKQVHGVGTLTAHPAPGRQCLGECMLSPARCCA
jgi:transposase